MSDYVHYNGKISEAEESNIKSDLLSFIHSVASGDFAEPEQIKALIPAIETVAKYWS